MSINLTVVKAEQLLPCASLTLSVQVDGEVLEDVHVCRVGDGAHGGRAAFVVDVSDGLRAHIQHQGIDQLDVVSVSWLIGHLMQTNTSTCCCLFFIKNGVDYIGSLG